MLKIAETIVFPIFHILSQSFESSNTEIQVVSSLALAKLWKVVQFEKKKTEITTVNLATVLIDYVKQSESDPNYVELSIEGLMYLSLYWEVRNPHKNGCSFN